MVTGKGNYILRSDRDDLIKAGVREASLHRDHRMVLAVVRGEGAQQNRRYAVGRKNSPLEAPAVQFQMEGGAAFAYLKGRWDARNIQNK